MPIRTVEALVSHLQSEGVRFEVTCEHGLIRAVSRIDAAIVPCCPLTAAVPAEKRPLNLEAVPCARRHLGMDRECATAILVAADNCEGHDPSIRALLLTLVS